jgi:hypothetical protein
MSTPQPPMATSNGGQDPSSQSVNIGRGDQYPHHQALVGGEDRDASPKPVENLQEGSRIWQTEDRDLESETCYRAGSATFIELPVDGKPVMALLLSYELAQSMINSVDAQSASGEVRGRCNEKIATVNQEMLELQQLLSSTKSAIEKAVFVKVASGQDQDTQPRMNELQLRATLLRHEEDMLRLQKEKIALEQEIQNAKEDWFLHMRDVSIHHDNAFIKAGIRPDYGPEESEETSSSESGSDREVDGAKIAEDKSVHTPPEKTLDTGTGDALAMVPFVNPSSNQYTTTSSKDVPQGKPPDLQIPEFLVEAEIKTKLVAARVAYIKAAKAHENYRDLYEDELDKFAEENAAIPEKEVATVFGPTFIKRGQQLICGFRDAEDAYLKAEKCAIDAGLFTVPDAFVEADANPYLDLDELDAMCVDVDNEHILGWGNEEGAMLIPPSIYTIDTFDDTSSSDDDTGVGNVIISEDQPPMPSVEQDTEGPAAQPAPESDDVTSSQAGKRKYHDPVQAHDSYSTFDVSSKRQRIDAWARKCTRWRARNLLLK